MPIQRLMLKNVPVVPVFWFPGEPERDRRRKTGKIFAALDTGHVRDIKLRGIPILEPLPAQAIGEMSDKVVETLW